MASDATIESKKIELISWLSTTEDLSLIEQVLALKHSDQQKDWWSTATNDEKVSIQKGLLDADAGRLNTHEKARDIYGKWL
ncbi:MAG: hypothetical protein RL660_3075 [Bacteroidota bacterium]|jgi:predicted transcriptional regulator